MCARAHRGDNLPLRWNRLRVWEPGRNGLTMNNGIQYSKKTPQIVWNYEMKSAWGNSKAKPKAKHIYPLFRHEEVRDLLRAVASLTTQTYNNISTSNNMPSHFFFKQQHCPSFEKEYQVSCWINWGSLIIFSTLSEPVNHLYKYIQLVWSSKILNTCNSQTLETWPTHKGTQVSHKYGITCTVCSLKIQSIFNTLY